MSQKANTIDFNAVNDTANHLMIKLITVSLFFGGIIYFISRHVILGDDLVETALQAIGLIALGASTQLLKPLPISVGFRTSIIAIILSFSYLYLYILRNENGFATLWGAAFVFMSISLFLHF